MKPERDDENAFQLDEDVGCWLQDGSLHVKVVTSYGDPVELNARALRLLAAALLRFADKLDEELKTSPV
jgi:hypothetical protein